MPPSRKTLVLDTSVLVDGRITEGVLRGEFSNVRIILPEAVLFELEEQAAEGKESGFTGLDEVAKLHEIQKEKGLEVVLSGRRPSRGDLLQTPEDRELVVDALVREVAEKEGGVLLTSDRLMLHAARARGIPVEYVRPLPPSEIDITKLEISKYFDAETMSVHLKLGSRPLAKKGTPDEVRLVEVGSSPLELSELTRLRREIIEAARRGLGSFVEIERKGATVVQVGPLRVAIAQPPFSDGLEITAVRPLVRKRFDEYDLPPQVASRILDRRMGVLVSGPPGSGKSTFASALAEWLVERSAVVKTLESPRDLQVPPSITQYAPLEGSLELAGDVLLLVRPDYVIFDEVRKSEDFRVFADLRLAGVGLVGVTHASRALDAIQRFVGRVELGMIPQIVETVVHVEGGRVREILEIGIEVKVPTGMVEADLARPVVVVRDARTKEPRYEMYTYGEEVVVVPVSKESSQGLEVEGLRSVLAPLVGGPLEVQRVGEGSLVVRVPPEEIPRLIGKKGRTIQGIEKRWGVRVQVLPFEDSSERRYSEIVPDFRKTKRALVLVVPRALSGRGVEIVVGEEVRGTSVVGPKGEIRLDRRGGLAEEILEALERGERVRVRVG